MLSHECLEGRKQFPGARKFSDVHGPAEVASSYKAMGALARNKREAKGQGRNVNLVEEVQFFSRLEADSASWGDGHFRACPRIASNPGFAGFDAEHAKAAQLNAVVRGESRLHTEENGIHGSLGLDARQTSAFRNFMYHVLFDQMNVPLKDVGCARPSRISMLGSTFRDCQWSGTLVHSPKANYFAGARCGYQQRMPTHRGEGCRLRAIAGSAKTRSRTG